MGTSSSCCVFLITRAAKQVSVVYFSGQIELYRRVSPNSISNVLPSLLTASRCAPASRRAATSSGLQGRRSPARWRAVFPSLSFAVTSAPAFNRAFVKLGDGNLQVGYLPTRAPSSLWINCSASRPWKCQKMEMHVDKRIFLHINQSRLFSTHFNKIFKNGLSNGKYLLWENY